MDERNYFETGSVIWDLQSADKFDAIREVIRRSHVFRSIQGLDLSRFEQTVIAREKLQSTGFGHGVAIAHGRTTQVGASHIAVGFSRNGVDYGAIDGKPVHFLFVVATHPESTVDYLRILSSLVTMVRNDAFRSELRKCLCGEDAEQKLCSTFGAIMAGAGKRAFAQAT